MRLEYGAAQRPYQGLKICGDAYLVIEKSPTTIVAVIDGLGHGRDAFTAAQSMIEFIQCKNEFEEPVSTLIHDASSHIKTTRGAAGLIMSVDLDAKIISIAGVGNIELKAVSRSPIHPVCTPGIIGRFLRKVPQFQYPITEGDLIGITTDGISSRYDLSAYSKLAPEKAAQCIVEEHGKHHDDATCVIVRFSSNNA